MTHTQRKFWLTAVILGLMAAAALLMLPGPSHASSLGDSFGLAAGANATWLDGPGAGFPVDLEATGNGKLSISPHLSAVASLNYGFAHSYIRWDGGFRATATDVNNPNFNMYLGIRYRGGSIVEVQPNEWAPDAGIGWKPWPEMVPNLIFVADASYGLTSSRSLAYAGLRYVLPLNLFK